MGHYKGSLILAFKRSLIILQIGTTGLIFFFLDAEVDVVRDPSRIFHENSKK